MSLCYETERFSKSGYWSRLQAHGLANSSLALKFTPDTQTLIYEIEEQWYNGKHPLTLEQHQTLTEKHKQLLTDYRDRMKDSFFQLAGRENDLVVDENLYSEENICRAHDLAIDIFTASKKCTDEFIDYSRQVLEASVDLLSSAGSQAPCPFAVVGLGSVARGEVTPYSDLEYAFIVESNSKDEYFEKLAMDSYFRLGNLGETPIKCFDIPEIEHKKEPWKSVFIETIVGYRIDGISKNAGNLPTGRPGGQSLHSDCGRIGTIVPTFLS